MDNLDMQPIEEETSGRTLVWFLLGVAALGCGLLFALAFLFFKPDAQALVDQYFPSATPTPSITPTSTPTIKPTPTLTPTKTLTPTLTMTPTPHVLITPPQEETVFNETFDANERKWYGYYDGNKVTVEGGKLTLLSKTKEYIGMAFCTNCPDLKDAFYLQAEMTTLVDTDESYGMAFCSPGYGSDFYVFQINPSTSYYDLYKHSIKGWETLFVSQYSSSMNDFPNSNILGVSFNQGAMEFYINNTHLISYNDSKPLTCRKSGFYVNDGKFDLIVDNVFSYSLQLTPTLSP